VRKSTFLLTAWLLIVVASFTESSSAASTEVAANAAEQKSTATEPARHTGIVEGIVRYQPDAKRPWKFSRYYVQTAKNGSLAEAVVALEGPTLAASASPACRIAAPC
jgi:hypothetical protein